MGPKIGTKIFAYISVLKSPVSKKLVFECGLYCAVVYGPNTSTDINTIWYVHITLSISRTFSFIFIDSSKFWGICHYNFHKIGCYKKHNFSNVVQILIKCGVY